MANTRSPFLMRFGPALVFLVAFAVRWHLLANLADSPYWIAESGDMRFYEDWAARILQGHWTDGKAFYGLPGYPFLLGGLYSLFGKDPFLVGVLQVALDSGTALLVFLISRRVLNGATVPAMVAGFAYALLQPAQAMSVVLMPTTWVIFVSSLLIWSIVRYRKDSFSMRHGWAVVAWGVLAGLAATLVASILSLVPVLLWGFCRRAQDWPRRLALAVFFAGGIALGTSPCWLHNWLVAKDPVFLSAHSGLNFFIGNNPQANGYPLIPAGLSAGQKESLRDSIEIAERTAGHELPLSEVSAFWKARGDEYISRHRAEWLRLLGTKVLNFWNRHEYDDLTILPVFREEGLILPGLHFGGLLLLAIPGLVAGLAAWPAFRLPGVGILFQVAGILPVFVTERYRLGSAPLLAVACGVFLQSAWLVLQNRQWKKLTLLCAVVALAVFVVFLPRSNEKNLESTIAYNYGIQALAAGNLIKAEEKLVLAHRLSPQTAEVNFSMGNLWMAKGDSLKARLFYRDALDLNPRHDGALNNLGVIALREKRYDLAIQFIDGSLSIRPEDGKTHFLMAIALTAAGREPEAENHLRKAEELMGPREEFNRLRHALNNGDRDVSPLIP